MQEQIAKRRRVAKDDGGPRRPSHVGGWILLVVGLACAPAPPLGAAQSAAKALEAFASPVGDAMYVLRGPSDCAILGHADVFTVLADALRASNPAETRAEVVKQNEVERARPSDEKPRVASIREWELSALLDRLRRAEGLDLLALYTASGSVHGLTESKATDVPYALADSRFLPLSKREVGVVATRIDGGFDVTLAVIGERASGSAASFSGQGQVLGFVRYRRRSTNAPELICLRYPR